MRKLLHQAEIVRDKQHRGLLFAQFFEFPDAAVGEDGVAHGQRLIDDQNIRIDVDGGGERQPDIHAARIFFHGPVNELADLREGFDGGQLRAISARPMPMISPLMKTFSRPVNSGLKPAPSSSSAAIRPRVTTRRWWAAECR